MEIVEFIIKEAVDKVSIALTPQFQMLDKGITAVHYDFGKPAELVHRLQNKNKVTPFEKYPIVGLFVEFNESSLNSQGEQSKCSLNMFIAYSTNADYSTMKRYEVNFVPILIPIYNELIKQLGLHKLILEKEVNIKHDFVKRPFWGSGGLKYYENGTSNVFADKLDAIEINNLELTILKDSCKK